MKLIEIGKKKYKIKTNKDELTFLEFKLLIEALNKREYKEIEASLNTGAEKEEVEIGKESEEFKKNKLKEVINTLSNKPLDDKQIEEYPMILKIIENVIEWDNLTNFESIEPKHIKICGKVYEYIPYNKLIFQQWCDFENLNEVGLEYIFLTFFKEIDSEYDRYFIDKDKKIEYLNNCLAKDLIPYINYIYENVNSIRKHYFAIYSKEEETKSDSYISRHFEVFKWEDIILTIAESKIFDSPKGPLYATRNANAMEVLDYLNIKTHRNISEYKDYEKSQQKNNIK